ncbi:sensor histidine kinase [Paenibacillaceae bacterium WGS1546]|uniref:sensor histidine kinase n=1 Tax=Cohnella sp. WGS1546 TaxID=3366810 RepID=UPI00372D2AC4
MGIRSAQANGLYLRAGLHAIWWLLFAASAVVSVSSHGLGIGVYGASCGDGPCNFLQFKAVQLDQLEAVGISSDLYGSLMFILLALQNLSFWIVGFLLYRYGWKDFYCLTASIVLIVTGTIFSANERLFKEYPLLDTLFEGLNILGASYLFFLLLFPEGRFRPRWTSVLAYLWLVHLVVNLVLPYAFGADLLSIPEEWIYGFIAIAHVIAFIVLAYRYSRESSPGTRRQLLWLILGICVYVAAGILGNVVPSFGENGHGFARMLVQIAVYSSLMIVPFSVGVIVLERRAKHLPNAFNRTMVYLVLSVLIVSAYALLVGSIGYMIQGRAHAVVTMLATGLLAVMFQPLREGVQRAVNHLVYGKRDDPYRILSKLTEQLESSLTHRSLLSSVAEKVAAALQLPYAAIETYSQAGAEQFAVYGKPVEGAVSIELDVKGVAVGRLILGVHRLEEALPPGARHMVDDLVRQVSIAVQTYSLTDDLRRSRERLVSAREEERRRLRRDLHDGLGSSLASMTLHLNEAIRHHGERPERSRQALETVQRQMRESIADIRRLVYSLRPPALDEFGLAFALQELTMQIQTSSLQISLEGPDRDLALSAAAEAAVYRIVQEALTNVVRHANASKCFIQLELQTGTLRIRIADNGVGMAAHARPGIGMRSIKERAEELGGTFELESAANNGTIIRVSLPIEERRMEDARNGDGKVANFAGG